MNKTKKGNFSVLLAISLFMCTGGANAAPVDLSSWTSENFSGGATTGGNWAVQNAPANDEVLQTQNGSPTVFFEAGSTAQGQALSGSIRVETTSDDDFIGFVLGFDAGEAASSAKDFILVDWKQGTQSVGGGYGNAPAGLAISHVSGAANGVGLWGHHTGVNEIARGNTLHSTGWADNTTYTFDLQFTASLIQVSVNNILELSITAANAGLAAFDDGAFGFYNYSQHNVRYSAVEESQTSLPVPEINGAQLGIALTLLLSLVLLYREREGFQA